MKYSRIASLKMTSDLPSALSMFNLSIHLLWKIKAHAKTTKPTYHCAAKRFDLTIPDVAHFLVLPEENCVVIERASDTVPFELVRNWLFGSVMAYILHYHDYLVLHGSAIQIQDKAILLSGVSGAGKSTLARAFIRRGDTFITDDIIVMKRDDKGQYGLVRGPSSMKLWDDAMAYFEHDASKAEPTYDTRNKFVVSLSGEETKAAAKTCVPVAFYELGWAGEQETPSIQSYTGTRALQTLMQNAYRPFMLELLGKMPAFFKACHELSQSICVNKLERARELSRLDDVVACIEQDIGMHAMPEKGR